MSFTQRTVIVHLHNETKEDFQLLGAYTDFHTFFRVPPPELVSSKGSCVFGSDCIHLEAEGIARAVWKGTNTGTSLQLDWRMGYDGFDMASSSPCWRVDRSSSLEHRGCRAHVYFVVSEIGSAVTDDDADAAPVTIRELGASLQMHNATIEEMLELKLQVQEKRAPPNCPTLEEINAKLAKLFEEKVLFVSQLDKLQDSLAQFFRVPAKKCFRAVATKAWNIDLEANGWVAQGPFLEFERGDVILVLDSIHPCWWFGESSDPGKSRGFFPSHHVWADLIKLQRNAAPKIIPKVPPRPDSRRGSTSRPEANFVTLCEDYKGEDDVEVWNGETWPLIAMMEDAVKIDVRGRHIVIPKTYFQYIPATPAPLRTSPSVPSPFSPTPPALPPPLPSPFAQSSVEPYARKSPFAIPPPDDEEGDLTSPRRRRKPAMAGDRKDPLAQYQQTGLEWIQQEEQKRQREQEEQRRQQELIDLEHRRKREAEDEKERLKHEELDIEKEELLEKLLHQQRLLQQHLPEANPAPNARNRESMSSIFAWSGQVNDDLAKILNWSPEEEERKKGQERKEREEREAREEKERKERKDKEKPSEDLDFEMMLSSLSDIINQSASALGQ